MRVVLCTRELHAQTWLDALRAALAREGLAADLWWRDASSDAADPNAPQAEVAIVWRPPAALFAEQRRLRLVMNLGAGVDALLSVPSFPRDVTLLRLEDAGMADALAEYVLAAVLRVYRGLDRYAAHQRAARWQPETLLARANFRLGVLGLGVIGGAIARTLSDHGFAVRGFSRTRRSLPAIDCRAGELDLAAGEFASFLDGLDLLVSVLPATGASRGVLNAATLRRLARGAHLVNVGRGSALVEADLLALIDAGHLAGATLDVFAAEPLPADHPFWSRPEILVTPHVSAVTQLEPSVAQVAARLGAWERGEPLSGVVDIARGY